MCGIAGFVDFGGHNRDAAASRVKRMIDTLAHRGPDGEGVYVDDNAALGHRRLAIIDLSTGDQPMSALGNNVHIVFNGEVYNFADLRRELEQCGHTFRTRSDTEVILYAYIEWGDECVKRLNGMFAFAIWDSRKQRLFLARDRVGKKPLYVLRKGSVLAFASELKAFRVAGDLCPHEIDNESLDCYLTMGYVPAPRTIYKNVQKLRPAHIFVATESGDRICRYWNLSFADPRALSMSEAAEEFDKLLDDAVACRLVSDVPLGAFLSGGVDSSLVVSSMAKLANEPVATHTIGFGDPEFDETEIARRTAEYLKTDHHEFTVLPQAADVMQRIAWHFDEPLADPSVLPTWYVCQMIRREVTVALSGDGGDEGFGGYTFRYVPHVMESKLRNWLPPTLRFLICGPLGAAWPASAKLPRPLRLKTILQNLAVSDAEAFYRDLVWLNAENREAVYNADFLQSLKGFTSLETVVPYYNGSDAVDSLGRSQSTDINVYMTDDVLVKVDRMSMAHGLEVRAPLLDHRVLEFGARLPRELKIASRTGKFLLREVASRRLPPELRDLPKRGFSIPLARWLRTDLKELSGDLVFQSNGLIDEVLDNGALQKLWDEHQNGSRDHSVFLWALVMLGLWDREYGKLC